MNGVQTLSAIENRSTAVIIADQLREGIVAGTFVSGDQINEAQLAERLQVSRGPVREALHRLVQEGLLEGRPNRGVFVKEVTRRDIAEVAEAREVIECAAAEVITSMEAEQRDRIAEALVAATEPMAAAVASGDRDRLRRADLAFHTQLVRSGENTRLLRAYTTLATEALICMLHFGDSEPDDDLIASHVHIAELMRSGDMEAVHLALHEHLSIDELDLHSHDEETLRHGRVEG
ncbi:DNA-binding GntR family transcriptional regulator [Agrococcus sp. UYP10]|uniref:GntR family transcriptional regulator n=1 Tax=Agrococcus jenensis TaxID=46353 RepID=A0A3N2ASC8_9MICO|nr:GntR family transcriptional regulator [Agrococcus jenensis]ROR65815.1 GntR family transcriptional regulator [Agrococcus jenensis]